MPTNSVGHQVRKIKSFVVNNRNGLIALALIVLLILFAFWILILAIGILASAPKEIGAVLITVSETVFVALATLVITRVNERKKESEKSIREKKIDVHSRFVKGMFENVFFAHKSGREVNQEELAQFTRDFTIDAIMWGSDDILSEWNSFKASLEKHSLFTKLASEDESLMRNSLLINAIKPLEKLLITIRKDVGRRNTGLDELGLSRLFVIDLDQYFSASINKGEQEGRDRVTNL